MWMRERFGRAFGMVSVLLILTNSAFVLWGRSVMLEAPALAMMIMGAFAFRRFLANPTVGRSLAAGLILAAALLLKQTAALLLPVLIVLPFATGNARAFLRRESAPGFVLVLVALGFLAAHAYIFGTVGIQATIGGLHEAGGGEASWLTLGRWLLYPAALAHVWPTTVLVVAGIGLAATLVRPLPPEDILFGLWLLSCYVLCTLLLGAPENAGRYTIYFAPPIAYFALRPLALLARRKRLRWMYLGGASLIIASQAAAAVRQPVRYTSGYAEAARVALSAHADGHYPLCWEARWQFHPACARRRLPRSRFCLRADKTWCRCQCTNTSA